MTEMVCNHLEFSGGVILTEKFEPAPMVPRGEVDVLLTEIQQRIRRNRRENQQLDRVFATELRTQSVFTGAHAMPDGKGWHATHEAGDRRAYLRIRMPVRLFDWISDVRRWLRG